MAGQARGVVARGRWAGKGLPVKRHGGRPSNGRFRSQLLPLASSTPNSRRRAPTPPVGTSQPWPRTRSSQAWRSRLVVRRSPNKKSASLRYPAARPCSSRSSRGSRPAWARQPQDQTWPAGAGAGRGSDRARGDERSGARATQKTGLECSVWLRAQAPSGDWQACKTLCSSDDRTFASP